MDSRPSFDSLLNDRRSNALTKKSAEDLVNRMISDVHNKTDFIFAFACPLLPPMNSGMKGDIMRLNHKQEFSTIDRTLSKLGKHIKYTKIWATLNNLHNICSTNPSVLHFSGHGVKADENQKNSKLLIKEDFLIIEDEFLNGQVLAKTKIKELFVNKVMKIQLAVVLSCHSKDIGEIFKSSGINHVICINRNDTIPDDICICFTNAFYTKLLSFNTIKI